MKKIFFAVLLVPMLCMSLSKLFSSFQNPPHASRPLVWWHWTASNVTREGITKDLEWMKRIGIGGFQAFDVSFGSGQSVAKKIKYMTPEWLELLKHTAAEAYRLGLEMTIVTAAGWSETGGIWVKHRKMFIEIFNSTKHYTVLTKSRLDSILPTDNR